MKKEDGKIILISGSKGGCGQSFICNCLSNYLSINTDKNILLMDFNTGRMDSRIIYKTREDNIRTIHDIRNISEEIDESIIKKIVVNFDNSLNVIFPPLYPDNLKAISYKDLLKIFKTLKRIFDMILVDYPFYPHLTEKDKSILNDVDKLLFVSLPDLISLSNLNIIIKQLADIIDYLNPEVIVNKYNVQPSISFALLSAVLKYPVDYFIPFDRDIQQLYLEKGPSHIFRYNLKIIRDLSGIGTNLIEQLF